MHSKYFSHVGVEGTVVCSAARELVLGHFDDIIAEELVQYCAECASVPVVCDTPAIVTLTSQILQSSKWNFLKCY